MTDSGIYQIRCSTNGRVYIGSSKSVARRIYMHRYSLRNGKHWNPYLQSAWDKYGEEDFSFEKVESCDLDELLVREQWWIDSAEDGTLLNLSLRARCPASSERVRKARSENAKKQHKNGLLGRTTWKQDPSEVAKRIVETKRNNNSFRGPCFEWTPERRAAVSKAMKERRAREAAEGLKSPIEWTPERRAKAAEQMKARWANRKEKQL